MMADAIRYHHEPLEKIKEASPLVKIIYVSNLLSDNNDDIDKNLEVVGLLMGLNQTDVQKIVEGAAEEVEQIAINLEIKVQKPSDANNSPSKPVITNTEHNQDTATKTNDHEGALPEALTTRIKTISLLSSFLESLVQAENVEGIIAACEQAMSILFNIAKVLFFLTDKDDILLRGRTSQQNNLLQTSQGLTLTLLRSSSLIVKTYHDMSMAYLTDEQPTDNLADKQIPRVLRCNTVLLVSLVADKKPAGVILLGLPQTVKALAASDYKLVQMIAQQVGLCLHLEKMKEQKTAELDTDRRAAVSMTAKKVAHEINNPLGIISNYIGSIKYRLAHAHEIHKELTVIDEEIQRISSMIGQLDMFSKDPVCHVELTDVNAAIEDIIQLVKSAHFISSGMDISFLPDNNLPQIMSSRDAIKQVLINLIKNGAESMNNGGSVTVKTRQPAEELAAWQGGGIEIIAADTGPGLPESVKTSLYSPFVTTKQNGHSGLGLSMRGAGPRKKSSVCKKNWPKPASSVPWD